jgi:hypothetical protein
LSLSTVGSRAAGCQPQFLLRSIKVPEPLRKRRYGSNQHKGKYTMQLLHSGVMFSGLPDYVNRLHHIKRGTGGKLLRSRGVGGGGQIPQDLPSESSKQSVFKCTWTVSKLKRLGGGAFRGEERQLEVGRV